MVRTTVEVCLSSVQCLGRREQNQLRLTFDGTSPDMWKRLAFITGTIIITLDVRTTNTQCASVASSAAAHLQNLERAKIVKYADVYYRAFRHFVIDLGGAVSE